MRIQIILINLFWACLFCSSQLVKGDDLALSCSKKQFRADVVPKHMSTKEKKFRFRCLVQPELEAVYSDLSEQYQRVKKTIERNESDDTIEQLKTAYNASTNQQLLHALKPHPVSIALAQAAIETGWGTSRFFTEANNLYGIRSSSEFQPRIAAGKLVNNKTLWLKRYDSINASITDYYLVLSRAQAYQDFRSLKMETRDPHQLVKKLRNYSERKEAYVNELSSMIRFNQFDTLDQ